MMLTAADFKAMTQCLVAAAEELCGGRLVMAHEGGYSGEPRPARPRAHCERINHAAPPPHTHWLASRPTRAAEAYVPFCGVAVLEALTGAESGVVDPFQADVGSASFIALQPGQDRAVRAAEANLAIALLPGVGGIASPPSDAQVKSPVPAA